LPENFEYSTYNCPKFRIACARPENATKVEQNIATAGEGNWGRLPPLAPLLSR